MGRVVVGLAWSGVTGQSRAAVFNRVGGDVWLQPRAGRPHRAGAATRYRPADLTAQCK